MNPARSRHQPETLMENPSGKRMVWAGRIISGIAALILTASGVFKILAITGSGAPADFAEQLAHLGYPMSLIGTLAALELVCVALYVFPQTSVLGAILMTGYLGGAISTHFRVGDAVFGPLVPAVLAWLGIFLRDERLRALIPWRTDANR